MCYILSLVTPSGKGVGRRKGVGSSLEGAGKWVERIPGWAVGRKGRCFGGGVVSWRPSKSRQTFFEASHTSAA